MSPQEVYGSSRAPPDSATARWTCPRPRSGRMAWYVSLCSTSLRRYARQPLHILDQILSQDAPPRAAIRMLSYPVPYRARPQAAARCHLSSGWAEAKSLVIVRASSRRVSWKQGMQNSRRPKTERSRQEGGQLLSETHRATLQLLTALDPVSRLLDDGDVFVVQLLHVQAPAKPLASSPNKARHASTPFSHLHHQSGRSFSRCRARWKPCMKHSLTWKA